MAELRDPWLVRQAARGYEIYAIALERAASGPAASAIPEAEAREEVNRAERRKQGLLSQLPAGDSDAPVLLSGVDEGLGDDMRLMARIALEENHRMLEANISAINTELAGELSSEDRQRLRRQRDNLSEKLEINTHQASSRLESFPEPKFRLTVEQILDFHEGKGLDDAKKWIL